MKRLSLWALVTVVLMTLLAACVPPAAPTPAQETPVQETPSPGAQQPPEGLPAAVQAAIDYLAQAIQVDREQISVLSFERVEWSDSCLGITRIDASCAMMITPGYRVVLETNGRQYEFHTNDDGTAIAPAYEGAAAEIDAVVAAAVRYLAVQLDVPVEEIVIGLTEPVEWPDSCLEQWLPETACAAVVTPGYRVILTHDGREIELHTNQDASQIVSVTRALEWHREGGLAGFNDVLVVYLPNSVVVSQGRSGESGVILREDELRSVLSNEEFDQWNRWLAKFGQVDIVFQDAASADAMTTTLSFTGFGGDQPSEVEQQMLLSFTQELFNRLLQ